ncbi:MAG: hypothetical protein ACLGHT_12870 [Acidimicrobiia bacterium]
MRTIRATVLAALVCAALVFGAAPASAQQTTTTLPGPLPVTGAPDTGGETAAPGTGGEPALARTGIELIPVVNVGIALILFGAVLLVALEVQRSGRRERSLWSY